MGLFWELFQQTKINEQNEKAQNLEQRVFYLEKELENTRTILQKTLAALEQHLGKDIDGNGKINR